MTATAATSATDATTSAHPLDPLSEAEFRQVRTILGRDKGFGPGWRLASVELREPAKAVVRAFRRGDAIVREARVVAWDTRDGTAYKANVSLTEDAVLAWDTLPGKQPNATADEFHDCDELLRKHPDVIAALAGRGITDMSLVLIDVWTYGGHLIPDRYRGRRIGWCDLWLREKPDSNPYAHPVSGLKLIVDMNAMELLEIEDTPSAGFPPVQGEYDPAFVPTDYDDGRTMAELSASAKHAISHRGRAARALLEVLDRGGLSAG